ncbi:MAG: polymer-forming cytoskeletal protein, partial [Bacteroidales bacterium]|nr:polymer-forming cytoskeletal protein [Bacteroidales bacterium]
MKKISIFTLLLTLVAGGLSAQTNTPRNLENTGNANNGWADPTNWRLAGTTTTTGVSIPTSIDNVNIVKDMDIKNTTAAVATSVIVKEGRLLKIEQGSSLACPTIVLGYGNKPGNIELSGTINGEIQAERGELKLKKDQNAVVNGNIVCGDNGKLTAEETSSIIGNISFNSSGDSKIKGTVSGDITCENGTKLILDNNSSVLGNVVFNASGDSQIKGTVSGNVTCDSTKVTLDESSSVGGDVVFTASEGHIKGSIAGNVFCQNGSNVKLEGGGQDTVGGNIIIETGASLELKSKDAVVDGTIIVGAGGGLKISGETAVTGDIVLMAGSIVNLKNLKEGEFGGTLLIEGGMSIDSKNLPDFLNPNKPKFDSTKVVCAKSIVHGWNFIGLPLSSDIEPLAHETAPAMWALRFNYDNNEWSENYLHYVVNDPEHQDTLAIGNGVFVYLNEDSYQIRLGYGTGVTNSVQMTYPYTENRSAADGRWFALANPYMKNIGISTFLAENTGKVQGSCVYLYNGNTFGPFNGNEGELIVVGDGFFVNMADGQTGITFNYPSSAKSKGAEREFVRVSVSTEGYKVPVMFAQNDDASDGYDIFDANKMFGDGSVAEPYLICNGINLCKEEVSSTNYTATMNIKSFESCNVDIVADNIPEGYSLTLIDGALEVVMNQGDVYTTDIAEGENADRFKLLITKNNVSIADVAEAESIRVVNNNRTISIYGGNDVRTEVYNALGQKVYETSDRV